MRIAVSTVAFPGVALRDLPRAARAVGAEGIALGVSADGAMSPSVTASLAADFLRQCEANGVQVSAIYGYAGRRLLDPLAVAADIDLAKRCIDLAASLKAPVCRLFAGAGAGSDRVIDRFVAACQPIVAHAAGAGISLGLPTHHDLAFDPKSSRYLIEGLGRAHAGIIFTGANLELDGIDPLQAMTDMADLVVQAEIKDWTRHADGAHPAPIGTGDAVVWPVIEALAGIGTAGWITLHHLRQHHPELPPLDPMVSTKVRSILAKSRVA